MSIDGGIAATKNDAAFTAVLALVCCTNSQPIAMPPNTTIACICVTAAWFAAMARGVHFKITGQVTCVIFVFPKIQRHRRNRLCTHQFTHLTMHGLARFIPRFNGATQQAALHDAGLLRQFTVATNERAAKIGTTRNITPPYIAVCFTVKVSRMSVLRFDALELCVAPILRFWRQR